MMTAQTELFGFAVIIGRAFGLIKHTYYARSTHKLRTQPRRDSGERMGRGWDHVT